MDERDFLDALKTDQTFSKEGTEFFSELRKTAGLKEYAGRQVAKGIEFASNNKAPLLGAVIGSAAATGLQYLANKPGKDGKPSKQRELSESSLKSHEEAHKKNPTGFKEQMGLAEAKHRASISQVSEQYPKRGALAIAPMGAAAGYGLGLAARKLLG